MALFITMCGSIVYYNVRQHCLLQCAAALFITMCGNVRQHCLLQFCVWLVKENQPRLLKKSYLIFDGRQKSKRPKSSGLRPTTISMRQRFFTFLRRKNKANKTAPSKPFSAAPSPNRHADILDDGAHDSSALSRYGCLKRFANSGGSETSKRIN